MKCVISLLQFPYFLFSCSFVSLIFVYIIAGLVINKYALHKEGSDIIPQKSFWKDAPILVLVRIFLNDALIIIEGSLSRI